MKQDLSGASEHARISRRDFVGTTAEQQAKWLESHSMRSGLSGLTTHGIVSNGCRGVRVLSLAMVYQLGLKESVLQDTMQENG